MTTESRLKWMVMRISTLATKCWMVHFFVLYPFCAEVAGILSNWLTKMILIYLIVTDTFARL